MDYIDTVIAESSSTLLPTSSLVLIPGRRNMVLPTQATTVINMPFNQIHFGNTQISFNGAQHLNNTTTQVVNTSINDDIIIGKDTEDSLWPIDSDTIMVEQMVLIRYQKMKY
ncbi:unnamed protein product [Rotaria sordida]|uniref:Uncharacterized protein n=1 Tax=Rotaria sordida TaxID=392033 RepID=A0A815F5I8_9BILA|nr:unnamed protein product [Rotaria sordida]CAF1323883.1 unnamed protein product [Rotaria sordida]